MKASSLIFLCSFLFAMPLTTLPAWAQTQNDMDCDSSNPDTAIRGCTSLIQSGEQADTVDLAYSSRARAYIKKGLYGEAIADYTSAIAHDDPEGTPEDYDARARTYNLMGQKAKALADANKAIEYAPLDPIIWDAKATAEFIETRAEIYEKLGQRNKAIADYRASLKLNPNNEDSTKGLKRLGGE